MIRLLEMLLYRKSFCLVNSSSNFTRFCTKIKERFQFHTECHVQVPLPASTASQTFGQPVAKTHPHLLTEEEVVPGIKKSEFQIRRSEAFALAQKTVPLSKKHIMIFPSASKSYMSYDIPYTFRQSTEFLYLCGFQEPDSLLVIHNGTGLPSNQNYSAVLFVPKKEPSKELWDGPHSGAEGALLLTGVDEAYTVEDIEQYLYRYCRDNKDFVVWHSIDMSFYSNFQSVVEQFLAENCHADIQNSVHLIQQLRLSKSNAEIELMRTSANIASEAFIEVMKFSYGGINEAHLYAKMDYECRIHSAERLAYPPVVAGGNRANTIHYINNNQIVKDGELVLMDAGCEYHGYCSDITRTWPVSGKFTTAQRALYNAVLDVQEKCISMCTAGNTLDQIYIQMLKMLGKHLQHLGILGKNLNPNDLYIMTQTFCPHHVGHYLGMDVHDTSKMSRSRKLQPEMVITIEPGIYIPAGNKSVEEEFRGIGIRIEDNILITKSKPEILSHKCPKHPDDIETLMKLK